MLFRIFSKKLLEVIDFTTGAVGQLIIVSLVNGLVQLAMAKL
jgi:hypothetical protein